MNPTPEKILIIRLSSIGDILLSTPFIRQTRKKFPAVQIDFVVKQEFHQLISANPHLDKIYQLQSGNLGGLLGALASAEYDYIFDLHGNIRSRLITQRIRSEKISRIKKNKFIQQLFVKFKINRYDRVKPIPERYLETGLPAGVTDDGGGLEFYWNEKSEETANKYLADLKTDPPAVLIAVAPGAGFYTKRWPLEYFIDLMDHIRVEKKARFIVLGDVNDRKLGQVLSNRRSWVLDLTGRIDLMEAGAILAQCQMAITNDSGMMHLATAVQTPVLALFGSSVREFGFFPFRATSHIVENQGLSCRPCSHIGRRKCPEGHFKCMRELTPALVAEQFENFMAGLR